MDIDSDFDEVAPVKRTTSITVTESDSDDSSHPIASPTSILLPPLPTTTSELPQTMDPPSPILPPPPGSISPPRFLNEDFDIRDEDDEEEEERNLPSLPSNLNASELLITPPPPMMDPNLVEESAGEEDDDDEAEDQQRRNAPNKVKDPKLHSGLDSLTSDMAAKLQSMISEEIEETIPKDPEVVSEWSSDPVTSPPPPVWRNDVTNVSSVVNVGSVDEEEDESSGNSQSPQQVHKILSPPPPAMEDEEEEAQDEPEDISRPEKCASPVPAPPSVDDEVNNNPRDQDDEPISLASYSSASLPPPAPLSLDASSDIVPPPPAQDEDEDVVVQDKAEAVEEVVQSPLPPPLATETAEERELLRKLMDDNEDVELLRQLHKDEEDDNQDDLPLPGRICGLAKELHSPPAIAEETIREKRESLAMSEQDYTKEEEDEDDIPEVLEIHPTTEELPKYTERAEDDGHGMVHVTPATPPAIEKQSPSPRDSVHSHDLPSKDEDKLEEESEPEEEEKEQPQIHAVPPPTIQEMIPKTISIPEKIHSPVREEQAEEVIVATPVTSSEPLIAEEPELIKEDVKPASPVKSISPEPAPQKQPEEPTEPIKQQQQQQTEEKADKEPQSEPETKKEEPNLSQITSPKGTRLDDFRKPYVPAYSSSLTSNKPPSYTSTVYTQPGAIAALNDRTRPVYMTEERRQRYSSPSSSLREQFFSSSSVTATTNTTSGAAPAKPPLTQTTIGGGSAGGMSSEEQSSTTRVESSSTSKTEVIRQQQQQQRQTTVTTQQTTISTSSTSQQVQSNQQQQRQSRPDPQQQQQQNNRHSGHSQMSSRRSQEMSEGAATSRGGAVGGGGAGGKQPSTPGSTGGDLEKGLVAASGVENGADPQGRLPDVSSLVKLAQDIESQSTCSRVVKAGDACSLAFSAIYSKLIIVLGISLPLVEVISPHHIPVLAYQGFYLYLYGVGILFLLFMFFSMCCCGRKAPVQNRSITPSTSATSHSEAVSKASGSKSKKNAKAIDSPQTPQEELQKRLDEQAAVAAAAAAQVQSQQQDKNGAGGDLNAATSTTNILTASPTAGGEAAAVAKEVAKKERKPSRKISYTFSDDGQVARYKYGSYFLRVGAVLFGLASIIYSALEFGQFFECKHLILTLTPGIRTVFILLQLYFIFYNNEKITFYPFKLIARVGLMHLIGTNLALWINVLIHETNNEFSYSGQVQNITVWTAEAFSGEVQWNMSGWNFEWQEMMADCPRTNLVGKLVQMASPYLFPCCIQYALICTVILYFMWRNVGRHPATPIGVLQQHSSISCSFKTFDCRQSYKGLFLGVIILASTIASVAAFFVLLTKDTFEKLAFTQLTLCELGLYGVTLIGILFGTIRMRKLQYDGARRFHLDEYLLIGAQIGLFLYSTLAILGTEFNLEPETIFTWVTAILSILQTVCQTMFILDASRRTSNSIEQSRYRPGREFVVFLLIANLALWIMSICQKSRPSTNPVPLQFYGVWAWTIITHLWSPLAIFYRFHSTVCLIEVSKRAYKIKPTFM